MDIMSQIAGKIIQEQEGIIGPVALEQAQKVPGIKVNPQNHEVTIEGDTKTTLENLVKQYEGLFGLTSVEICKEAVRGLVSKAPKEQIPQVLL